MPVLVSVPTKIRVDREALLDHPDWVEEALRAALGRALTNSRRSVLDLRGGYLDVCLHSPTFAWRGHAVCGRCRTDWEARIADLLAGIADDAGVMSPPLDADVPEVLPSDPSEPYDETRGERVGAIYGLDSYGGTDTAVPVANDPPLMYDYIPVVRVSRVPEDDEMMYALEDLAESATAETPKGLIFRIAYDPKYRWLVLVTTGGEAIAGAFRFPSFMRAVYRGPKAEPPFAFEPYDPPPAPASAEVVEVPQDEAGRDALFTTIYGDIAATLGRVWSKPARMTTAQYEERIKDRVGRQRDWFRSQIPNDVAKAVKVKLGEFQHVVWILKADESNLGWKGTATLEVPEEFLVRRKRGKKGESKERRAGGSAKGSEKGRADGEVGGGDGRCPKDDIPHGDTDITTTLECEAFLGEPAVDEIGDAGVMLAKQVAQIAHKLGISECKFPGQFCYHAAVKIEELAQATLSMEEPTEGRNVATQPGTGNMGPGDFKPNTSPIIDKLRDLADAVSLVNALVRDVTNVLVSDYYGCSIHGMYRGEGNGWALHFHEEMAVPMWEAVGTIFTSACRSMLLQMLTTSFYEIQKRIDAIDRYAPMFERWILPKLATEGYLETLRKTLRNRRYANTGVAVVTVATAQGWAASTVALTGLLSATPLSKASGDEFEIVWEGGVEKIRDNRGVLWSEDDLEQGIKLSVGTLEGIDPLVKQMTDTPETVKRFKEAVDVKTELLSILTEMKRDNLEIGNKAFYDPHFCLRASSIREDIPQATITACKYSFQGIHLVAHQAIGDAFKGSGFYATGLNYLFDSELGKDALKGAGILIGTVLLCVFVPGGAFLVFAGGVALASHELDAAKEKERLYKSLINPDQVLSHAEVEVGLFVAYFGLVMSFVPEAGTATKALLSGGKAVLKGEAKQLGTMAAKAVASRVAKELAEYAAKDLLAAFIHEIGTNFLMDQIIQQAMKPVIEAVEGQASIGHGNAAGADAPALSEEDEAVRDLIAMILEETSDEGEGE